MIVLDNKPTGRYGIVMKKVENNQNSRDRLIHAMMNNLRKKGYHGIGLSELLEEANASKGALYHHFKGGKIELALTAIDYALDIIVEQSETQLSDGKTFDTFIAEWFMLTAKQMEKSRFEQGCPIATIALESTGGDDEIRSSADNAFRKLRSMLKKQLVKEGLASENAENLSITIISIYEGSLIQARVANNSKVFQVSLEMVMKLVKHEFQMMEK